MNFPHLSACDCAFLKTTKQPPAVRILLFVLLLMAQSASAIVSVGPNNDGCVYDYDNIQAAIDHVLGKEKNLPQDVDPYISVVGDLVYNEALVIDGSSVSGYIDPLGNERAFVQIYGDYDQACQGKETSGPAKIGAGGSKSGNSVIEIKGDVDVVLNHFVLTDASGVDYGGGINFHGSGLLDLTNLNISGNHAHFGAGINVHGEGNGLTVNLLSTTIESNTAANSSGSAFGGGFYFNGHGKLNAENTVIDLNQADFGGGIAVDPDGPTDVSFDSGGVWLLSNTANVSGGGIFAKGQTNLFANAEPTSGLNLIGLNKAPAGYGGGILAVGPAYAVLSANIFSNSASYGGGIALVGGSADGQNVSVHMYSLDPNAPVNISGNTASIKGGGIYVRPSSACCFFDNYIAFATFFANDFRIDLNQAPDGSAIYADGSTYDSMHVASAVHLNEQGARPFCVVGAHCNEINSNTAATVNFVPTDGSTVFLQTNSTLSADRLTLQKNEGGHLVRDAGHDGNNTKGFNTDIGDCLISDNQVTGELFHLDNNLVLDNCTLANNTIGAQHVIRVAGAVDVTKNIIDQDIDLFDAAGNSDTTNRNFGSLLTNHLDATLPMDPTITVGTPHFVNAANLDYHLLPDSPGLDAATTDSRAFDLDGYARDVDLPFVPNFQSSSATGVRDLGAYELQLFQLPPPPPPAGCAQSDTIFCNGFDG